MTVGDGSLAAAGGDDGNVGCLGQFDEGRLGIGAGHPAPGIDDGQAGSGNDAGCLPELVRTGHYAGNRSRVSQLDLLPLDTGLRRDFDENGAGPAGTHLPEGFEYGVGYFPGPERLPLPLGHRAHHVGLVGYFMNGAQAFAHRAARNLAGDDQDGG